MTRRPARSMRTKRPFVHAPRPPMRSSKGCLLLLLALPALPMLIAAGWWMR